MTRQHPHPERLQRPRALARLHLPALAVLTLAGLGLAGVVACESSSSHPAGESQLPEEAIYERYAAAGDDAELAAARQDFVDLLERRRAWLDRLAAAEPREIEDLGQYAMAQQELASGLRAHQAAEVFVRVDRGVTTPGPILDLTIATQRAIHRHGENLARLGQGLERDSEDWRVRDVFSAREHAVRSMIETLVYLRGTERAGVRQELFTEAQQACKVIALPGEDPFPASLEELDARHPDAGVAFGARSEVPPPTKQVEVHGPSSDLAQKVAALYRRLLEATELESLRELFVDGYWPEDGLREALAECRGCRLGTIDSLQTRQLPGGDLEVAIGHLEIVTADGQTVQSRDDLVLRPRGEGFVIVYLGPAESRPTEAGAP